VKALGKRSQHILVLDADPAILDYVYDILSDRLKVSLITQASELERHLNDSSAPDLLLMDWDIAEGENDENALGLLAKAYAQKPLLPIIMLACSADLKEVITATQMGAADVVLKPFRKSDIDAAVEQCLLKTGKQPVVNEIDEIQLN